MRVIADIAMLLSFVWLSLTLPIACIMRDGWMPGSVESHGSEARTRDYQKRMWDWFHAHFNDSPRQSPRKVSPLQAEYDLLGCPADATDEAARNAYRMAAKKYHPDTCVLAACPRPAT